MNVLVDELLNCPSPYIINIRPELPTFLGKRDLFSINDVHGAPQGSIYT